MSADLPARSEADLTPEELRELEQAHAQLRAAVDEYQLFVGGELEPGQEVPVVPLESMSVAQARVDAAEEHLWEVRERLLGWRRPGWAPRASLVGDWFSDEDADYDQLERSEST